MLVSIKSVEILVQEFAVAMPCAKWLVIIQFARVLQDIQETHSIIAKRFQVGNVFIISINLKQKTILEFA